MLSQWRLLDSCWRVWQMYAGRPVVGTWSFMTEEQIVCEALKLIEVEDYIGALPLWEQATNTTDDHSSKCIYLLNQARCLRALGQYDAAEQRLRTVEKLDVDHRFHLHVQTARTDELYRRQRNTEANRRTRAFLTRNAAELTKPEFSDLAYEARLSLGFGLLNEGKLEEGLQQLSEILPRSEKEDRRRIYYFSALAHNKLKQEDQAIMELKKVIDPQHPDELTADAHYVLGMIYMSRETFAWAKEHLQMAEELKDKLTTPLRHVHSALAHACLALGDVKQANMHARLAKALPTVKT